MHLVSLDLVLSDLPPRYHSLTQIYLPPLLHEAPVDFYDILASLSNSTNIVIVHRPFDSDNSLSLGKNLATLWFSTWSRKEISMAVPLLHSLS